MNIRNLILIAFIFVLTVAICIIQPKMSNPVIFENEPLELNQEAPVTKNDEVVASIPPVEIIEEPEPKQEVKQTPKPVQKVIKKATPTPKPKKVEQPQQVVKPVKKAKPQVATQKTEPTKVTKPKPVEKTTQTTTQEKPKAQPKPQKVVEQPQPEVAPQPQQPTETAEQKKQREEREEIIAWNKWRSDLQNKVMKDSRLSAPLGTVFRFSCTVDKFGNITNIKTWSDNPSYTPLATRTVKPVLASYQNKSILTFPANSRRVITNVTGAFTISTVSRYSTPDQYSDYERIKR